MLGEIAFDHPLFAPLAGAQFNDFTKIRFWKHRKLDPASLGDARVLARFEGGDPALSRRRSARGGSSSWPAAGARSTASSPGRRSSSP